MKLLVCGGRDFNDPDRLWTHLEDLRIDSFDGIEMIIHGGADGADSLAGAWAQMHGIMEVVVPAPWQHYGKRAGMLRNQWMLRLKPDLVVAMPGGRGTAGMVKLAEKAGVPINHG